MFCIRDDSWLIVSDSGREALHPRVLGFGFAGKVYTQADMEHQQGVLQYGPWPCRSMRTPRTPPASARQCVLKVPQPYRLKVAECKPDALAPSKHGLSEDVDSEAGSKGVEYVCGIERSKACV